MANELLVLRPRLADPEEERDRLTRLVDIGDESHADLVQQLDKAAAGLGYRAATSLEEGLARTARWFESALADRELAAIVPHAASGSD